MRSFHSLGGPPGRGPARPNHFFSLLRKRAHFIRLAALRDRGLVRILTRSNTIEHAYTPAFYHLLFIKVDDNWKKIIFVALLLSGVYNLNRYLWN